MALDSFWPNGVEIGSIYFSGLKDLLGSIKLYCVGIKILFFIPGQLEFEAGAVIQRGILVAPLVPL